MASTQKPFAKRLNIFDLEALNKSVVRTAASCEYLDARNHPLCPGRNRLGDEYVQSNHATLKANAHIPELRPQRQKGATVKLPAVSIGFIAVPGANNPSCR
jgi:hypothetical protein